MPPKKLLSQLGNIEEFAATYTADIQHRDDQGKNQHIRGPGRSSRIRAERDLAFRAVPVNAGPHVKL